ncbi:hypothetical protein [Methylomagnum sp.]
MNPSLTWQIEAARRGDITVEAARAFIEAWPGYQAGELRQKAEALERLSDIEVERLRSALRRRRGE